MMATRRPLRLFIVLCAVGVSPSAAWAADPPSSGVVTVDQPTQKMIDGALKFLASKQELNGSWSPYQYPTAMTSYALVSFLSAGHVPSEGPYGKKVALGMQYLLDAVRPDGFISSSDDHGSSKMYGHGIATIALAEMYGMTADPTIRPKLAKAVRLIVNCQNDKGGWRYAPRVGDADLSVTVLQTVALRAAKDSGIDVPQESLDRAMQFIRSCSNPQGKGFGYMPGDGRPTFACTAAGTYALQVCGQYNDPAVKAGSASLSKFPIYMDAKMLSDHWMKGQHAVFYFTYGAFYAAPAQYMVGGETWVRWYEKMRTLLANKVNRGPYDTCSWKPIDDETGQNEVYATAIYTTILDMPLHYLPLYQR